MNVLLFNLASDPDDPILGFTMDWIAELAVQCTSVDVITMRSGSRVSVPENVRVYSVGKERGFSEARRFFTFYRLLLSLLRRRRYDVCVAHMMPLFLVMAAPVLWFRRIPSALWYCHRETSAVLWLAEKAAAAVFTCAPEGFRLKNRRKVRVVGHGIATRHFNPGSLARQEGRVIAVGRIARVKRLELLVEAVALLSGELELSVSLRLIGPVGDSVYAGELHRRIRELRLEESVTWIGSVSRAELAEEYRQARVLVNCSPTGGMDKVVLEAAASGVPCVVTNASFSDVVDKGVALVEASSGAVAASCSYYLNLNVNEFETLSRSLSQEVKSRFAIDRVTAEMLSFLRAARGLS